MKITSEEIERQRRLGPTPRQNQTTVCSATLYKDKMVSNSTENTVGMDIIQLSTKVVDSMKQPIQPQQSEKVCQCSQRKMPTPRRERTHGCSRCVEQGLPNCNHCFFCGEEGHGALGCLKRLKRQGNWIRSLQGGAQWPGLNRPCPNVSTKTTLTQKASLRQTYHPVFLQQ